MFFVDWFEEHGNIRLRSTRGESMRSKLLTHCAGGGSVTQTGRGDHLYNWNLAQRTMIAGEESVKCR